MSRLRHLWMNLVHRDRVDRDLDAELQVLQALLVDEKVRAGQTPDAAERAARLELGPIDSVKAGVREVRAGAIVEQCVRDVRHAVRLLRRSPAFTLTAVLTLAIGIGANTAVFSVVDAALLRPLPFADAHRLVAVTEHRQRSSGGVADGNLADYRQARTLDGLASYDRVSMSLTRSGTPEQILGEAVTWNIVEVLGMQPALGRAFRAEDGRPGAQRVVILTDGLWRRRFGADTGILGRALMFDDAPYVVVGVMPPAFTPLSAVGSGFTVELLTPIVDRESANRTAGTVSVVARLAPGATIETAQAEMNRISADLARRLPDTNAGTSALITPLRDKLVRADIRLSLIVMVIAVGLVLLVACLNLGSLLIVRSIAERAELATRLALGATRAQLTLDLVVRGLVLGVLGGVAGLIGGVWIHNALVAMAPPTLPGLDRMALNPRVLGVAAALSILAGGVAGLLPAAGLWRRTTVAASMTSGRTMTASRWTLRWRGVLLAAEVAAALVLTIGAGLLVRSLVQLGSVELGFRTDNVLMFSVRLPESRYPDQAARSMFFDALEARVSALSGVQAVTVTDALPMRGGNRVRVALPGAPDDTAAVVDCQLVSPGYFATLDIPVVRGRPLDGTDRSGAAAVAVVSAAFVRRFLPDGDPVGRRVEIGAARSTVTIVGIVGDVRRDGRDTALAPQVYFPAAQSALYDARLLEVGVRTAGDPLALGPAMQEAVWSIDPDQPVTHLQPLDAVAAGAVAVRRFNVTLLGALAAVAVALALVGIHGAVAYAAAQRTQEMGIRVALGAPRRHIIAIIVGDGMRWAAAGVAAGVLVAVGGTRVMTGMLFGVPALDPTTFGAAAALVMGSAGVAGYLSARRAREGV